MLLPSRDDDYLAPPDLELSREVWDAVFGDIGARMRLLEGLGASWESATARILDEALLFVRANLEGEIERGRNELEAVRKAFDELQSGGFAADRIAARLSDDTSVRDVQQALSSLAARFGGVLDVGVALDEARRFRRVVRTAETVDLLKPDDDGLFFDYDGQFNQNSFAPSSLGNGWQVKVQNSGLGHIPFSNTDGFTWLYLYPGDVRTIYCDGSVRRSVPLHLAPVCPVLTSHVGQAGRTYRMFQAVPRAIHLPPAPKLGDTIRIMDGESPVTNYIGRSGKTIMGLAEDITLDMRGYDISVWWNGDDWRLF